MIVETPFAVESSSSESESVQIQNIIPKETKSSIKGNMSNMEASYQTEQQTSATRNGRLESDQTPTRRKASPTKQKSFKSTKSRIESLQNSEQKAPVDNIIDSMTEFADPNSVPKDAKDRLMELNLAKRNSLKKLEESRNRVGDEVIERMKTIIEVKYQKQLSNMSLLGN